MVGKLRQQLPSRDSTAEICREGEVIPSMAQMLWASAGNCLFCTRHRHNQSEAGGPRQGERRGSVTAKVPAA